MNPKQMLGSEIAKRVQDGDVLGLGTGSTAEEGIKAIESRIMNHELREIYGVPTSNKTEALARSVGINIIKLGDPSTPFIPSNVEGVRMTWGFDGADEVEKGTLNLLKGGGGAMTREKSIAKKCPKWIVIVDESKLVNHLGETFPIPLEVREDQMHRIIENLYEKYHPLDVTVRQNKENTGPFLTDFGNLILDMKVSQGSIKPSWEKELEMLPGIVGTGLFLSGYPDEVWVGRSDGTVEKLTGPGKRV